MSDFSPLDHSKIIIKQSSETLSPFQAFVKNPLALFGIALFLLLILSAFIAPLFSIYDYDTITLIEKNSPPSSKHWFGTDALGRDLFIRSCYGVRISFFVAFCATLIDISIGVLWGGFAALKGGWVGQMMMRIVDMMTALPSMLLVILILVVFSPNLFSVIIALSITGWLNMARIVRGQVLKLQEEPYILASKCMGANSLWLIRKHMIPSLQGTIIVALTLTIPSAIFTEAFLSFIGLGVQAPQASLGVLASDGVGALSYYPWRLLFPGCVLCLLNLSFHCMGHVLSNLLNPKLQSKLQVHT